MTPVCVLCALLSATTAHAETPFWYDASEVVTVLGHSADLAATQRCLGSGRCHETNPWLLRFQRPTGFALAKMSVASVGLWATRKIPNKTIGAIVNYSIGVGFCAIAVRNERVGR
jgi:hypothetical protein